MAITRVQEKSTAAPIHGSGTASASFSSPSTSGNLLIAAVMTTGVATAGVPSGFTSAGSESNINGPTIALFYYPNAPSTTTISSTLSGTSSWVLFIAEYSGIITSSPLDQTNSATTTSGSAPVSGNITTVDTNELIVAGLSTTGSNTFASPTGGFSLVDTNTPTGVVVASAYLDLTTATIAGGYSTSANTTTGGNGVIASFISTTSINPASVLNAILSGSIF